MLHFYKTPGILKKISKDLIWDIQADNGKEIYVTFDDGPIPQLTEYLLDVLSDFNAKATFFCVGENIVKQPELFDRIIRDGHAVGNHTYNHLKGWSTKNKRYFANIEKCQSTINNHLPKTRQPLFRPPHGQITRSQIKALRTNYKIIMWDILAYDFDNSHAPEVSLKKLVDKTAPGSIVVFHDNYKAESKIKYMLPKFLDHFALLEFKFKKIGQSGIR